MTSSNKYRLLGRKRRLGNHDDVWLTSGNRLKNNNLASASMLRFCWSYVMRLILLPSFYISRIRFVRRYTTSHSHHQLRCWQSAGYGLGSKTFFAEWDRYTKTTHIRNVIIYDKHIHNQQTVSDDQLESWQQEKSSQYNIANNARYIFHRPYTTVKMNILNRWLFHRFQ